MTIKKILVIGPSWLGDMIMAQAMFKLLKQRENCTIDVLAPAWSLPILACMHEVTNALEMPVGHGKLGLFARYQLGRRLRKQGYKQAIVLTNTWKSALVPFWAKIPQRTGWLGECRWGLLNDVRYLDTAALPKMVQRYAALAYPKQHSLPEQLPLPKLEISAALIAATCEKFQIAVPVSPTSTLKPILALCPGAAFGSAKRWPESYYIELALEKMRQGWDIWVFGSQQDLPVATEIQQGLTDLAEPNTSCKNFAGKLTLPQTVALLARATAVVSNDSGLMHLAASLDKPLIGIFGSTSPEFTPPLGTRSKIIAKKLACSPCRQKECPLGHHRCMLDIPPGEVLRLLECEEV